MRRRPPRQRRRPGASLIVGLDAGIVNIGGDSGLGVSLVGDEGGPGLSLVVLPLRRPPRRRWTGRTTRRVHRHRATKDSDGDDKAQAASAGAVEFVWCRLSPTSSSGGPSSAHAADSARP